MKSRVKLNKSKHREVGKEKRKKKRRIILKILVSLLLFIVGTILYARYIGTSGLIINEYNLKIDNLPDSFHGVKLVHFTDLHYGSTFFKKELNDLKTKINNLEPDLIVFTGDLIDEDYTPTADDLAAIKNFFNDLEANIGKYIISGNHDYKQKYFLQIVDELGFKFLDNEAELIYYKGTEPIMITGLSSSQMNKMDIDKAFSYYQSDNHNQDIVNITLLHEPDSVDKILKKYPSNLFLAGHSHNGQVRLPIIGSIIKVDGAKKYYEAHYVINDSHLYISGGLGESALRLRLFCHPSINMYRLIKK